jgi:hypothetical protein
VVKVIGEEAGTCDRELTPAFCLSPGAQDGLASLGLGKDVEESESSVRARRGLCGAHLLWWCDVSELCTLAVSRPLERHHFFQGVTKKRCRRHNPDIIRVSMEDSLSDTPDPAYRSLAAGSRGAQEPPAADSSARRAGGLAGQAAAGR